MNSKKEAAFSRGKLLGLKNEKTRVYGQGVGIVIKMTATPNAKRRQAADDFA